jgi:hypothetical protein
MNAFKKLISISILAVIMVVTLSPQVEAKKFDRSYLGLGKSARARHSSFLGGDPDRPVIAGSKTLRKSSAVRVSAGDVNRDDRARKRASRKSFILPYLEQDNVYK